jgi:phenylacetate-coenzyme A ligase PaaK-like adenylate-forming protein
MMNDAGVNRAASTTDPASPDRLRAAQVELLRQEIERWRRELGYYAELFPNPVTLTTLADMSSLPIQTKEDVRRSIDKLIPAADKLVGKHLHWGATSGTTGDRLPVLSAGEDYVFKMLRVLSTLGGEHRARLAGGRIAHLMSPVCNGTECHRDMNDSFETRLSGTVLTLNSGMSPMLFSEQRLQSLVDDIRRHEATVLRSDAAYAMALARYVLKKKPDLPQLDYVTVSASVPSRYHVRALERAFGCPVMETYGMTELQGGSTVACESGHQHLPHDVAIVEILDSQARPVSPGQMGRIHLTTLRRSVMPFLRYQTSDLACAVPEPCGCGRVEPVMGMVLGRVDDLVVKTDGKPLTPRVLDEALFASIPGGIAWYSLAQVSESVFRFTLVAEEDAPEDLDEAIRVFLTTYLGQTAEVHVQRAREIRPAASGKFRLCYQERPARDFSTLF